MATHQTQFVEGMRRIRLDQGRMEATEEIEVVFDERDESVVNSEESNEVMASANNYGDMIKLRVNRRYLKWALINI